jgi:GxxExxY protein
MSRTGNSDRVFDPNRYPHGDLTEKIIGAIIEVHRHLGPGFIESAYEIALTHELRLRGFRVETQKTFPISYKGVKVGEHICDMIVSGLVLLELKAVEKLHPVHMAQIISTLKAARLEVGLLINFNEAVVKDGIKRVAASDLLRK